MIDRHTSGTNTEPWFRDHALWAILVVAALVRVAVIAEPIRFDEAVTYVEFVRKPWAEIVSSYPYPNNHVFYSLLAKAMLAVTPVAEWAIRLPALVAGLAIVPLTYGVGRAFGTRHEALLGAAMVTVATPLVLYSVNARGYSLVSALFLVELLLVHRLRRRSSVGGWLAFTVVAALGAYTIPVMLYPHGIVGAWLGLDCARKRDASARNALLSYAGASVTAALIAALLYLPIVREEGIAALIGNKFVTPESWGSFVVQLPRSLIATIVQWGAPLPLSLAPIPLVLAVVGLSRQRRERPETISIAVATVLWCGVLLVATHRVPFMRVWIFLLPLYALAVASGIVAVTERVRRGSSWPSMRPAVLVPSLAAALGALSLVTSAVPSTTETGAFPDAPDVAAALKWQLRSGDRVLAPIPTSGPLLYYFIAQRTETRFFSTREDSMRRAFIVLDRTRGQSLPWAVEHGMIDPRRFTRPRLVGRFGAAELWLSTVRGG